MIRFFPFLVGLYPIVAVLAPRASIPFLVIWFLMFVDHLPQMAQQMRVFLKDRRAQGLLGLIGAGFISAIWGLAPDQILIKGLSLVALVLMGFMVCGLPMIFDQTTRDRLARFFVGGVIVGLLLLVLFRAGGQSSLDWLSDLKKGAVTEWSFFNSSLNILAILCWPVVFWIKKYRGMIAEIFTILLFGGVFFSYIGVAAQLAFLLGGGLYFLFSVPWVPIWRGLFVAGLMILNLIPALLMMILPITRVGVWLPGNPDHPLVFLNDSNQTRLLIWDFTWEKIWQKPIWGWGLESSRRLPGGEGMFDHMWLHPHNGFLQIWMELGVFGAAVFLTWLFYVGWGKTHEWHDGAWRRMVPSLVVSVGVMMAASYGVWQSWWWGSVLMGVFFLLCLLCRNDRNMA